MQKKDLISVIVPVYNVENTLKKCLDSIISQTYKNLEIILVNDGSTDKSKIICEEYREKDSRIVLINKSNGGLSSARNVALDVMNGDYVSFVDSDDWIEANFIEKLYEDMLLFNCDITISYTFNITTMGDKWRPYQAKSNLFTRDEGLKCNLGIGYPCDDVVWNKLYKSELFKTIRFPHGRIHEDTFVMAKLISKATKLYFDESISYYYLQRDNSLIHQSEFGKADIDKVDAYLEIFSYISQLFPHYTQLIGKKYTNCIITTLCRMKNSEYLYKENQSRRILNEYENIICTYKKTLPQKLFIYLLKRNCFLLCFIFKIRSLIK